LTGARHTGRNRTDIPVTVLLQRPSRPQREHARGIDEEAVPRGGVDVAGALRGHAEQARDRRLLEVNNLELARSKEIDSSAWRGHHSPRRWRQPAF